MLFYCTIDLLQNQARKKYTVIQMELANFFDFHLQSPDCLQNVSILPISNYRQMFLRSNDFTEWISTFLPSFQSIYKKGWVETLFFPFDHFF